MLKRIIKDNKIFMLKIFVSFKKKINKIFIGRPSTKMLDNILINCYGTYTNLNKISHITLINCNVIKINLFDISLINIVKNSIIKLNLNLNLFILGKDIIINLPKINENRRMELVKIIRCESENSRISIRKIRRNSNLKIKNLYINKIISIDVKKENENKIQEETNLFIRKINLKLIKKEKELLKI